MQNQQKQREEEDKKRKPSEEEQYSLFNGQKGVKINLYPFRLATKRYKNKIQFDSVPRKCDVMKGESDRILFPWILMKQMASFMEVYQKGSKKGEMIKYKPPYDDTPFGEYCEIFQIKVS